MTSDEPKSVQPLSTSQQEMLEEATKQYQDQLTDAALEYLDDRGIDMYQAVTYRLGLVGRDPYPGHQGVKGRLAIPYLDRFGIPLGLRFRLLPPADGPKYLDLEGATPRLYNVASVHRAAAEGDVIHLAEGELDAIILESMGLSAVAVSGAQKWTSHHRRMLSGFNRIWVWADPDEAGAKLANKVTQSMHRAKVVRLEDGDVGECYVRHGPDYLLDLIKEK